jgi:hypothetical protein
MEKENANKEVKNEHYVPESYLKWFADEKGKINVYDYEKKEYRKCQSPKKIARIGKFYDFDKEDLENLQKVDANIDEKYIENMFARIIEPALRKVIEMLSNLDQDFYTDSPSIQNKDLKLGISYLLVFQLLRTRSYRQFLIDLLEDEKEGAVQHKLMLLDQDIVENLAKNISTMSWTLCYNISKRPYITSDNPVVITNEDFHYGHKALVSDDQKMILYPLTSKILLQILNTNYTGTVDESSIDVLLNDIKNDDLVDFPNSLQMENACQYVFTSYDFPNDYFYDKQAGYKPITTYSDDEMEYADALDNLIEDLPKLSELLKRLNDPNCSSEDAIKISKEAEEIYENVNHCREKLGKERFKFYE